MFSILGVMFGVPGVLFGVLGPSWCFVWHTWCFGWRNIFSDLWMAEDLLLHATSVEKMHPAETCRIPKIIDLYISNLLLASQLIRTWYFKIVVDILNN